MKRTPLKRKTALNTRSRNPCRVWQAKADRLWQEMICRAWAGRCARCGASWNVAGHHLVTRARLDCRHEPMNGIALCASCHGWAHEHPHEFQAWLESRYPGHAKWFAGSATQLHCRGTEALYKDRVAVLLRMLSALMG